MSPHAAELIKLQMSISVRVTGTMEHWPASGSAYSTLMLAPRITLPHFSVSSEMSLPKSADELTNTAPAKIGNPRLQRGIGKSRVDFLVELFDDLGGRALRRAHSLPLDRFVSWYGYRNGRGFRQSFQTRCSSHRQGAQFACPDL